MTATDLADPHGGYEDYYGLAEPPFSLRPDPRFLFDSRAHSTAFDLVMEAFRRRETLIVVTGEIGTGKTVLCRTILQRLPRRTFLSVITNPLLDSTDLLKQVLEDFGILSKHQDKIEAHSRHDLIRALERFLTSLTELQAHAVIMIDEAQHLQPDVLEQIRLLSNFEAGGVTPLQIVLVGQPDLTDLLARPDMRQLEQRISHRCELRPLEASEVEHYIQHRLEVARGGSAGPGTSRARVSFSSGAVRAIAESSGGLPRVVNLLCDRAMEDAAARHKEIIDTQAAVNAATNLGLPVPAATGFTPPRYVLTAAAVVLLAVMGWLVARAVGFKIPWPSAPAAVAPVAPPSAAVKPPPVAPPASPPEPAPVAGTLRENEIFMVLVASFRTPTRATAVTQQIVALGLPAFIRTIPGDWRLVLVGPYASRDETSDVQRRLDDALLTGSRAVSVGQTDPDLGGALQTGSAVRRVFLLPAFDRQAIVVDLAADATRAVLLDATDDRLVDVEIGSFQEDVISQDLKPGATSGVVDTVEVRGVREQGRTIGRMTVRTRMPVTGAVRVGKQRVYIDLVPRSATPATPAQSKEP